MKKLNLSADLGGSKFKGLGSKNNFRSSQEKIEAMEGAESREPLYIEMAPAVIEADEERLKKKMTEQSELSFSWKPENYAFIGVDNTYYAVGQLAEESYLATPSLAGRKIEQASQKILAAVWVAAQKLKLGEVFVLDLRCVLPPSEYKDKNRLKELLEKSLREFDTPSGKYKVQLGEFVCKPEGHGMLEGHLAWRKKIKAEIGNRSICVLTLGHRDSSCFKYKDGEISSPRSSKIAFSALINGVIEKTSGYQKKHLINPVALYLLKKDESYLEGLEKDERYRKTLLLAIEEASKEYIAGIYSWLKEEVPLTDDVIFGGGTAQLFIHEIEEYFASVLPSYPKSGRKGIFLNGGLKIPEASTIPRELGPRYIDVYYL
jgi:hypothetical protein